MYGKTRNKKQKENLISPNKNLKIHIHIHNNNINNYRVSITKLVRLGQKKKLQ